MELAMSKLGRVKDDIYYELWHRHIDFAESEDIQQKIEALTDARVTDYFKDRRGAKRLRDALNSWVLENYGRIGDPAKIEMLSTEDSPETISRNVGGPLFRHMLDRQFGREKMIVVGNAILRDPILRDEFYAQSGEPSSKDFSFLLDFA
jgi:hypothetical protein